MSEYELLLDTEHLRVEYGSGSKSQVWVTFGALGPSEPFGRRFIEARGEAAVYFIPKRDHWYQVPEVWEGLRLARERLSGAERVITYGSSMGGFGAIAFANDVNADCVISAAPQISVQRAVVGDFDNRWTSLGDGLDFQRADARDGCGSNIPVHLIFDPLHLLDTAHVRRIGKVLGNTHLYPYAAGGHGVLHTLLQAKALKSLIEGIVEGDLSKVRESRLAYKKNKRLNANYYYAIAENLHSKKRYNTSLKFSFLAFRLHPWGHYIYQLISSSLWETGNQHAAIEADKKAIEFMPNELSHYVRIAQRYVVANRPHHAIDVLLKAPDKIRNAPETHHALYVAYNMVAHWPEAFAHLAVAIELRPTIQQWQDELSSIAGNVDPAIAAPLIKELLRSHAEWADNLKRLAEGVPEEDLPTEVDDASEGDGKDDVLAALERQVKLLSDQVSVYQKKIAVCEDTIEHFTECLGNRNFDMKNLKLRTGGSAALEKLEAVSKSFTFFFRYRRNR